ncbi:MAG: TRAP transporter substrate-binding protein [Rhizobiaceae bacterium]
MNQFLKTAGLAVTLAGSLALSAFGASAQEFVLKAHHFLSTKHNTHAKVLKPWADKIEAESKGRIKIQIYPSMQLGGKPPQLLDQVRDGVADIVWALPGYTPGRYPKVAAFELPFMVSTAEATSQALQEYYEKYARDEFKDIHPLWFHTHARGFFHTREGLIKTVGDLKGKKMRAPNRGIGTAMEKLGAGSIFMPVPALPEALSKGVVDGAALPWEIVPALKVNELAPYHTEIGGDRGLYTAVFVFAMNKDKYNSLPDDLKKVIDDNSGLMMAKSTGKVWDAGEEHGIAVSKKSGNEIFTLPDSETDKIREMTKSVTEKWIADMGADGQKLYDDANALLDKYSK